MLITHIRQNFAASFYPRRSEWIAAFTLFGTGWMLSANPDLMATAKTQAYNLLQMIAPQPVWSVVLMVFAFARLLVLLVNGAWRRSPYMRAAMAFLSCFLWTQIVLSFAQTFGFAFILAVGFLGMDMLNIMCAMGDARSIDHAHARRNAGDDQ
ncbi:hypothetical protein [Rhizobium sp. Root483D2]|uniref:hypothetical protein n=1 Tax=Rhizobium sp. Root483D2 TaxID=1736545 RepID=UPI000713D169|nr:hypothetical protein [Rhizobium sp. Root483D2]KQY20799.1 hypothetical protein ASD32_05155 [Rhizobium sp. Root483D2]